MKENEKKDLGSALLNPSYGLSEPGLENGGIGLLELLAILRTNRMLIIAIFLVITFSGCLYALMKPDVYEYSSAIQIGSLFVNGQETGLDNPKNAESKVKEIYMPSVLGEFYRLEPSHPKDVKLTVTVPKESHLVILSGKASIEEGKIYQDLIYKISGKLIGDHNEIANLYMIAHEEEINKAKARLKALDENGKDIANRIQGLDIVDKTGSAESKGATALAMAELISQKELIETQKFEQESLISQKQAEVNLIRKSKPLNPVTQSIEPVSLSKALIVVLSMLMGGFIAVFAALVVDFFRKDVTSSCQH